MNTGEPAYRYAEGEEPLTGQKLRRLGIRELFFWIPAFAVVLCFLVYAWVRHLLADPFRDIAIVGFPILAGIMIYRSVKMVRQGSIDPPAS